MKAKLIERQTIRVVHISEVDAPVRSREDALDVMVGHGHYNLAGIAIEAACLHSDFFVLRTGVAGEMLQIFVNYRMRIAVVGDFFRVESGPLHDFIVESNRGRHAFFVSDVDEAIARLSGV